MFKLSTTLSQHIEEEIYTKVVASAEEKANRFNKRWATREEEGKTYETKSTMWGTDKINWYGQTKGFLGCKGHTWADTIEKSNKNYQV